MKKHVRRFPLSTATNMVVATVGLFSTPLGVAITPDGASVYATSPTKGDCVKYVNGL